MLKLCRNKIYAVFWGAKQNKQMGYKAGGHLSPFSFITGRMQFSGKNYQMIK